MAFLDDDEVFAPEPDPARRVTRAERQRQFLARRAVAALVGFLFLVLIVLAVRGCLDARNERAIRNYVSDLRSIAVESNQLSDGFFARLSEGPGGGEVPFNTAVNADRGTAEQLLSRVGSLSVPGDLTETHELFELSLRLRRDAISDIATQINDTADPGRPKVAKAVLADMETLLAADVLFRRGRTGVQEVLNKEEILDENLPSGDFLPRDGTVDWLDQDSVLIALGGIGSGGKTGGPADGVHGLAVTSVSIGGVPLTEGSVNTVAATTPVELEVTVENQGEFAEEEVPVVVEVSGTQISGRQTLSVIDSLTSEVVSVALSEAPPTGQSVTITVSAGPVPGEAFEENNTLTFDVVFE